MSQNARQSVGHKKLTPLGVLFALLGLLLFGYFVRKAGVSEILSNIRRLGAGFLLVLLISSVRKCARALAWTRCFEGPQRLKFFDALKAVITGDSLGTVMPLGVVVSEPVKVLAVVHRVPPIAAFSAIAVENIFYSISVMLFIVSGTLVLLLGFTLENYR
ncbi:MAG TPA: lysylphosphatidylglycerol synthase domain-containing protein, partial [Pyrinomonadaceae bacterium]